MKWIGFDHANQRKIQFPQNLDATITMSKELIPMMRAVMNLGLSDCFSFWCI